MSTDREPAPTVASASADRAPRSRGRPRDAGAESRILHAAFVQLVEHGYDGLSVESVAAAAAVAKTTIYRRYPTKRDLVVAAVGREVPLPLPPADLPARQALERFVRGAIEVMIGSGAVRILASLLVVDRTEPGILGLFRERVIEPRRATLADMLSRGVDRGELRPDLDPLVVTEMIAGAIFGHHVVLGRATSVAWIASLVDHLWAAVAAR
jgi:AcrR family transcriptional regulator